MKFAATIQPLNKLCNNMDLEMRRSFVGPMPVEEFLDNFLPVQLPVVRWNKLLGFGAVAKFRLESQMYNAFVCPLFNIVPGLHL